MPETTPLIKAALNLRGGAGFDVYEETHAKEGKLWIRYVPEVREYMRKKKKDEIGMCQRRGNTCERGEFMD